MDDEKMPVAEVVDDIGLSAADVTALKNDLLKGVMAGDIICGDILGTTMELIESFMALDNQAILRDEMMKRLTDPKK
jgi:hypothetical protein